MMEMGSQPEVSYEPKGSLFEQVKELVQDQRFPMCQKLCHQIKIVKMSLEVIVKMMMKELNDYTHDVDDEEYVCINEELYDDVYVERNDDELLHEG
ncbi:hypothetical protein Tco_0971790 [Tanacetum coccineum]